MILTQFGLAEDRLRALQPLLDDYAMAEDPAAEFPNNVLSKRTMIWESGAFSKTGETPRFSVESDELALCRALADRASAVSGDLDTGLGSDSSDPFLPFFIAANTFDPVPVAIDPGLIAARFAGTLFPAFGIYVEPLDEATDWWRGVETDAEGSAPDHLERWRTLVAWFKHESAFTATGFVSIGTEDEGMNPNETHWPPGTIMAPCLFPRLMLGLTKRGSLCGLLGWCVYS